MSDSVRPHWRQPTRLPRPWDSPGKNTGAGCHFLLQCMNVKSESEVAQSCPTLRGPMDRSLAGSSVHGIFQARVLEWGAIAFSGIHQWVSSKFDYFLWRSNAKLQFKFCYKKFIHNFKCPLWRQKSQFFFHHLQWNSGIFLQEIHFLIFWTNYLWQMRFSIILN